MALTKGVNSYVTVDEADAYFSDRLDVSAWVTADATSKAQALVTATKLLEDVLWTGIAVSESQSLAFPRVGEYFDPRVGSMVSLSGIPKRVTESTYELAHHLLTNDGMLDDIGIVDSITIGPITISKSIKPNTFPKIVKNFIRPLQLNRGASPWWRAN